MSSKTDQKSLELLYENIVDNKELLLEEEKEYIDKAAKNIVQQLYEGIASYTKLAPRERLCDFISTEQVHIGQGEFKKFFSDASYEDQKAICYIFEDIIFRYLVEFLVYVVTKENQISISFRHLVDFSHMINNPIEIPYEDTQEVLKMLKNVLSHAIVFLYTRNSNKHSSTTDRWKKWREEQLKFEGLRKKLPELEGLI